MADLQTLMDMGFSQQRASRALELTANRGVEPAMEWLLAHSDEPMPEAASVSPTGETLHLKSPVAAGAPSSTDESSSSAAAAAADGSAEESKSIKCNECNRVFALQSEVEFHASRTGHINFSESTEEKKPLTEAEKRDQLQKLEEKLRTKRVEREHREAADALERERLRIQSGKDMGEARRKMEELEMKKIVDQRKREKQEEKVARDRVKQQIEADKLARKNKLTGSPPGDTAAAPATAANASPASPAASAPSVAAVKSPPADYKETRIQVRLATGQALTQTFSVKEPLSAVRLFIQMNQGSDVPFSLMTTFPRKVFDADDFDKPLEVLGLVPSAVVIVTKVAI